MKILRIQRALESLFRKEGNIEILGVSSLENVMNIYYTTDGEVKIYTEGINENGIDNQYATK